MVPKEHQQTLDTLQSTETGLSSLEAQNAWLSMV